jgi:hypothetical protein
MVADPPVAETKEAHVSDPWGIAPAHPSIRRVFFNKLGNSANFAMTAVSEVHIQHVE